MDRAKGMSSFRVRVRFDRQIAQVRYRYRHRLTNLFSQDNGQKMRRLLLPLRLKSNGQRFCKLVTFKNYGM